MIIDGREYSFTQPVCTDCWVGPLGNMKVDEKDGVPAYRVPARTKGDPDDTPEQQWVDSLRECCLCARATTSGIFIRIDPSKVPNPTPEEGFEPGETRTSR